MKVTADRTDPTCSGYKTGSLRLSASGGTGNNYKFSVKYILSI